MKPNDKPCMDAWNELNTNVIGRSQSLNVRYLNEWSPVFICDTENNKMTTVKDLLNSHNELQTKVAMLEKALNLFIEYDTKLRSMVSDKYNKVQFATETVKLMGKCNTTLYPLVAEITKTKE